MENKIHVWNHQAVWVHMKKQNPQSPRKRHKKTSVSAESCLGQKTQRPPPKQCPCLFIWRLLASFESPNIQRISGIQLVPPWLNHWSVVLGRHHLLEWLPCFQLHEPLHWLLGQPSSRARISRWSKGLGVVIAEQWFPLPLENRVFV